MNSDRSGLNCEQLWEYKKLRVFLFDLQQSFKDRRASYFDGLKEDCMKTPQELIDSV
jgi:hypothetical protein